MTNGILRSCAICGSASLKSFWAHASDSPGNRVSIIECRVCQFAWQYPVGRTELESVRHFAEAFYSETKPTEYFNPARKLEIAGIEYDFLASLPVNPSTGGRLLDLGGGDGSFALVAAEHGWNVTVVDPAIDPAQGSQNLRAIRGALDDIPEHEVFDVVTLWDVIEHIVDPFAFIESVRNRIRPGGWIVLETGNYRSADRIQGGNRHWIYQLDHRWYFSPTSITALLEANSFSDIVVSNRVLRPGWNGQSEYRGPRLRPLVSSLVRRPLQARSHIEKHIALKRASQWQHAGLGIFCVAARRPK